MHAIFTKALNLSCCETNHYDKKTKRYIFPIEFCSKQFFNVLTPRILSVNPIELQVYKNAKTIELTQRAIFKDFRPNEMSRLSKLFPFMQDAIIHFPRKFDYDDDLEKRIPYFPFLQDLEFDGCLLTTEIIEGIERTNWLKSLSIDVSHRKCSEKGKKLLSELILSKLNQCFKRLNELRTFKLMFPTGSNSDIDLDELFRDCHFSYLTDFTIQGCHMRTSIRNFSYTLTKLVLYSVEFDEGTSFLSEMRALQFLTIAICSKIPKGESQGTFISNIAKIGTLIELKLMYLWLEYYSPVCSEIVELSKLKKLKSLNLAGHGLEFTENDIHNISKISSLKNLGLGHAELSTKCFQHLSNMPNLSSCDLFQCRLHGRPIKSIPNVKVTMTAPKYCDRMDCFLCADWPKN
jgi:hypothetical protein